MSVRDREELVVARLQALAPHLDGEPDPAFRAATRARLVAMAAVRSPEPEPVSGLKRLLAARRDTVARPRWRHRLTAGLAGAALTVTAAASLVALAGNAHPGDVLYGLKRGTEQTQLALAGDARGTTLLGFASTRLDELRQMVDRPGAAPATAGADPQLVVSTLRTMDDQTTQGTAWLTERAVSTSDAKPLDALSVWVVAQSDGLAAMAPELPAAADAAVRHSQTLLSAVATRGAALQVALDCTTGSAVGAPDALGPTPGTCAPAGAQTPGAPTAGGAPGAGTTIGPAPSTPAAPTPGVGPGGQVPGTGGGTLPAPVPNTPSIPGLPNLPVPTNAGGLPTSLNVPPLPLPGSSSGPLINLPPTGSLGVCLPTVVNC
ncbi:MAG TPA: DUF5667 domain-containing protein [Blastococcus sp.]|nr:DUF5667 domain-containing protein [Blastococcus sp.]